MTTAREIIDHLGLTPHPEEGGWFLETHRANESLARDVLPGRYAGPRAFGTAIYYLLTPDTYSHLHRLASDEIFHFYAGGPCEMLHLYPDGRGETVLFGGDLLAGQRPQVVVPKHVWQGMRLLPGAEFALMGCTVAPGFEYADYLHGDRAQLTADYPEFRELIAMLTAP
ncbi:cupin domain-containing protein [Pseudodesulfovibrio indicus]|uniref:cupin domain-containing protein n=1 Tax=Pseudodesulfovibrio indicus TaxID=1716143 RepID=UPI00292FE7E1|nr:cupin domain-containing protein [Pseudodesulfovibrio indicus]